MIKIYHFYNGLNRHHFFRIILEIHSGFVWIPSAYCLKLKTENIVAK